MTATSHKPAATTHGPAAGQPEVHGAPSPRETVHGAPWAGAWIMDELRKADGNYTAPKREGDAPFMYVLERRNGVPEKRYDAWFWRWIAVSVAVVGVCLVAGVWL